MKPRLVAVITGASAGIGRATALRLAKGGAAVVICARRRERLEEVAAQAKELGGDALPIVADVTSQSQVEAVVAAAMERFGRLDVMMCNAGFGIYGRIGEIPPDRVRRLLDVNVMGTYHGIHAALPIFREQQSGHFIIISSIVGRRGVPFTGAYAATKFAQVGMTEALRAELHGTNIHATVVYPVSTNTEFFAVMTAESGFAARAAGPRQTAEQVADAIARAIEKPVPEVYPYPRARALAILSVVAPGYTDRLVQRWRRGPD